MPTAFIKKFRKRRERPRFAIPEGTCVYAIGDVHGCLDPLNHLLDAIETDAKERSARSHLVLLGDLVDRGPRSAQVLDRLLNGPLPADERHFVMGNHEEAMLKCYEGMAEVYDSWLKYGGLETLISYGLWRKDLVPGEFDLSSVMQQVIPPAHIAFIKSFQDQVRIGDYLFVHAGIRPGVPLDEQSERDLRWIRRGFLDDRRDHGCRVVHGHTIVETVEFHDNRIALDTGCYLTGRLSAVALEADSMRVIATS